MLFFVKISSDFLSAYIIFQDQYKSKQVLIYFILIKKHKLYYISCCLGIDGSRMEPICGQIVLLLLDLHRKNNHINKIRYCRLGSQFDVNFVITLPLFLSFIHL